jgi:hypothetical protein
MGVHYICQAKSALLQSHDELRAVVPLAGIELRKRRIGRKDGPRPQLMRRVLREARDGESGEGDSGGRTQLRIRR